MNVDVQSRVVFVTAGEAPPMELVRKVDHPRGVAEGRELDSFLAELDAGHDVPGLLVAAGGEKVIEVLRRHERTACLPIFEWGTRTVVAPGWDGNVVRWETAQLAQVDVWYKVLQMAHPVADLEEQERREHHFLRYLASRGVASQATVAVFGVDFPKAAIARWQRDGWVTLEPGDSLCGTADLVQRIAGDHGEELQGKSRAKQPTTTAGETTVSATAERPTSLQPETPPAIYPQPVRVPEVPRRLGVRDVILLLLVSLVVVDLWSRYGAAFFFPEQDSRAVSSELSVDAGSLQSPIVPEPLPELSLDAHLSWEIVDCSAPLDGIVEWRAAESGVVQLGEVVAYLVRPRESSAVATESVQQQLDGALADLARLQDEANAEHAAEVLASRQAQARAASQRQAAVERVDLLQQRYDRVLELAEEGVLSYREIRPDWDNLLAAKDELALATANAAGLQLALEQQLQTEATNISELPLWKARISTLRAQLQSPATGDLRIPVIANHAGFFVRRVLDGAACSGGEVLGQLRKSGAGTVEAILATADWDPVYLQGVARLRRPQRSSWMPTRILAAESLPTGLTSLRLRLPVGWLDGSSGVSVENATQLELRITAPLSSVRESK